MKSCGKCNQRECKDMIDGCRGIAAKHTCQNVALQFICRKTCNSCEHKPVIPDDDDDPYFKPKPFVFPKPVPFPLGVASGTILSHYITASSFMVGFESWFARPLSGLAWCPSVNDFTPWLQVNVGSKVGIHALGVLGHSFEKYWVTKYKVQISDDGFAWTWLKTKDTKEIMVFDGDSENNKWKRFCLHRYYGHLINTQYVRFYPVAYYRRACMRVELYGFRGPKDKVYMQSLQHDVWTKRTTGCQCYWDKSRYDCACCQPSGCQCSQKYKNQCVQCGQGGKCGVASTYSRVEVDNWTSTMTGCACQWDKKRKDCACCQNGACQCGRKQKNQCVQCGSGWWQCGAKQEIFGVPTN